MIKCRQLTRFLQPVIVLSCIFITSTSAGQTTDQHMQIYDNATLHTVGRFYYKGNNRISFGALKKEFTSYTTKEFYRKAKADRVWGGLLSIAGAGALITGIVVRKNNPTLGNVLSGAAIAINLGGLHFSRRSDKLTDQAIWQRNREILFGIQP